MMRILSVSETRALESTADMAGHSYAQMMELAGQGVAPRDFGADSQSKIVASSSWSGRGTTAAMAWSPRAT